MDEGLRLLLLGKPQVSRDGTPVTGFIYNKSMALLVYLAVTRRPHSREALAGLLWGEMPDQSAKGNLRKILSALREVAGTELIIDRQTVAFDPSSKAWLDTAMMEAQLSKIPYRERKAAESAQAANILPESDVRQIEDGVGLYRGDFLEGFYVRGAPAFEEWVLSERERLRQMVLYALYRLVGHYTARGDYDLGLARATRLLTLEPWHEEVHQQMMLLLALSGQRSAAMDQFETCRRLLADELGAEPNRDTVDLYRRIVRGEVSAQRRAADLPRDWPADATPFVGRSRELAKLAASLVAPETHLVTVVGIGGVGKTRMVLRGAAEALNSFGQEVHYVPLDGTSTAEATSHAIMRALALPLMGQRNAAAQLIGHLRGRRLLLVLDQLGPQAGVADFIHEVIRQAPGVRLLVASASRLNLAGEWVLPLYGLEVPETDDADEIRGSEAVQLFMQTVRRACDGCGFEDRDLPHLARICRLVDGLPLGIELAAGWARLLSFQEIAQEIEKSYCFLASAGPAEPERHSSLSAALEYSWAQMSAEERTLVERLSVFRGGFVREAAEQVAGASLPSLAGLMDRCLIQRTHAGRYQAHRLLSQYGREKLAQTPQEEMLTYERYCEYYTRFLQRQMKVMDGEEVHSPLTEIAAERENLQAAWQWAVGQSEPGAVGHDGNGAAPRRFLAARTAFDTTTPSAHRAVEAGDRRI
jgi:DNA-binding SARP family transcriptional activator/predicted ATPase